MTTPHPPRIVVFRTSRFVGLAVAHARGLWPNADLRLVLQQGAESEADGLGIDRRDLIVIPGGSRITPMRLLTSAWGWQLLLWQPERVVLQWWNAAGRGHEAVDRAALLVQSRGFDVVLADASAIDVDSSRRLWRPIARLGRRVLGTAIVAAIALASLALWPMSNWSIRRERRRMAGEA